MKQLKRKQAAATGPEVDASAAQVTGVLKVREFLRHFSQFRLQFQLTTAHNHAIHCHGTKCTANNMNSKHTNAGLAFTTLVNTEYSLCVYVMVPRNLPMNCLVLLQWTFYRSDAFL